MTDYCTTEKPLPDVIDTPKQSPDTFSEHFAASEFVCRCCGQGVDKISPKLIELLELLRTKAGNVPIHVNCGYRCPKHNSAVGGVHNSQHLQGTVQLRIKTALFQAPTLILKFS